MPYVLCSTRLFRHPFNKSGFRILLRWLPKAPYFRVGKKTDVKNEKKIA